MFVYCCGNIDCDGDFIGEGEDKGMEREENEMNIVAVVEDENGEAREVSIDNIVVVRDEE